MKCLTLTAIALIAALSFQSLRAQTPQKFNYQAIVRGNAGIVIAGKPLGLRFSIRDGSATGTIQYSETQLTTSNTYGLVNVQVGAGTVASGSFAAITWNTGSKFLQVEVDTTGSANYVALATVELIAVPYAVQAQQAVQASRAGVADSATVAKRSVLADSAVAAKRTALSDSATVAGKAVKADSAGTAVGFSGVLTGDVGGTQNATAIQNNAVTAAKIATGQVVKTFNGLKDNVTLTVSGGTTMTTTGNTINLAGAPGTITGVTAGGGLTGGGTSGSVSLAASFGGNGAATTVSRSDHTHAGQLWSTSAGNTLTLQTTSASFNSSALEADVTNATSQAAAIFAQTFSTNNNSAAIVGQATGAGGVPALLGIGLGANTYAVLASAQGAGSTAGLFLGNVSVTGTLSKGAGSFKIDHPLDPANKYLYHSFVESPDMMNIYDGNVVLDGHGGATITMPDWFEALNRDFRYQLTAMGKPSPNLYVDREISGNQFHIAGGTPGAKVSWMVTGIRHDAYANAHRIPVEEMKKPNDRGKYLNPEAFGRTSQQSIFTVPNIQPRHRTVSVPVTSPANEK